MTREALTPPRDRHTATVVVSCVGEVPILLDEMDDDRILDIMRGASAPTPPKLPDDLSGAERNARMRAWYRESAARGIPRDAEGHGGVTKDMLLQCLIEAGEWIPNGNRTMLTDRRGTRVPAILDIAEEFLPFPSNDWDVDIRFGKRGDDERRVTIARAKFRDWSFTATIRYDPDATSPEQLRALVNAAGFRIGLGSFRKDPRKPYHGKRAVFGRFRIAEWTALAAAQAA